MAFSTVTYTYSSSKTFNVTFSDETGSAATGSKPYLATGHIKVRVNGTDITDYTVDDSSSTTTITIGSGTSLTAGDKIEVYRQTPRTLAQRTVDFVNASILTESNLDQSAIHGQFLIQEALDNLDIALQRDVVVDRWDANSKVIKNVATPLVAADAATKDYVDTQVVYGAAASAQAWELTANGSTSKFQLTSPVPSGVHNELFIVEVDGVMQSPSAEDGTATRDFKVYLDSSDDDYYIEFESGSFPSGTGTNCPPNGAKVSVQNMGASKSTLQGAVLFEANVATDVPVTLRGAGSQSTDLLSVKNSANTVLFKVTAAGLPIQYDSSGSEEWSLNANGITERNGIRTYGVAQAGGFSAGNGGVAAANMGEKIGGTHSYTKISETVTRVTLGTTMPDTDYLVTAVDVNHESVESQHPADHEITNKTTTTFDVKHRDGTGWSGVSNNRVIWKLMY